MHEKLEILFEIKYVIDLIADVSKKCKFNVGLNE